MEVGTNIGTHTVPLAKALARQNRRLLAFEPQPVIFQNMCANLALNALGNVMAWPSACGDRAGTLYFSQPDYAAGGNFGGVSMSTEPIANGVAIPCIELDEVFGGETGEPDEGRRRGLRAARPAGRRGDHRSAAGRCSTSRTTGPRSPGS
jgi:FkbM family methyltransferase